ncbi:hypothetical protein D3C80_1547360 [compost metagenome]
MADANAQTVEVRVITEFTLNIFQTVMAAVTATEFNFRHARRDIQLVMGDQNFIRLNAVELRHCQYCFAAEVHKGGRHQQTHVLTGQRQAGGIAKKLTFFFQLLVVLAGEEVDVPGTGVMAGLGVLGAGIGQSNDQFNAAHDVHFFSG